MSRSYKHIPLSKDNNAWAKKYTQRKVRNHKGYLQSGCVYRRLIPQYDFCDWKICTSWSSYCRDNQINLLTSDISDYKKHRRLWRKLYYNK